MTIKEAIFCMKSYLPEGSYERCPECRYYGKCKSSEAHKMAIEALEELQAYKEVWNKLREEITEYKNRGFFGVGVEDLETGKQTALDWVLGAMENLTPKEGKNE